MAFFTLQILDMHLSLSPPIKEQDNLLKNWGSYFSSFIRVLAKLLEASSVLILKSLDPFKLLMIATGLNDRIGNDFFGVFFTSKNYNIH